MSETIERPYILHMFTATPQMSPFDVNMAADAGYQVIVPYCGVDTGMVANLTQDAIFSRGPKGVSRTGIFIGGRDVMQAADMLDTARNTRSTSGLANTPPCALAKYSPMVCCISVRPSANGAKLHSAAPGRIRISTR